MESDFTIINCKSQCANIFSHASSTCDQGLICHGASLDHFPINRKLSSWNDLHNVTSLHQLHHHLLLAETQHRCYHTGECFYVMFVFSVSGVFHLITEWSGPKLTTVASVA